MTPFVENVCVTIGWFVGSFLFWRELRREGVEEDQIFDLTFYSTLVAFIASRLGFVIAHNELFLGKSLLLVAAIWVTPGLSWLSGLVFGVATLVVLSRAYRVRLGVVLDGLAISLPWALVVGLSGRIPTHMFDILAVIVLGILVYYLGRVSAKSKWPYGIVGVWFFLLYALFMFALEFTKESRVYWGSITANQWILIGIFAESVGVLYVRGGGRALLRPLMHKFYEFISQRYTRRNSKTS